MEERNAGLETMMKDTRYIFVLLCMTCNYNYKIILNVIILFQITFLEVWVYMTLCSLFRKSKH